MRQQQSTKYLYLSVIEGYFKQAFTGMLVVNSTKHDGTSFTTDVV
jgi:hypothetical protein